MIHRNACYRSPFDHNSEVRDILPTYLTHTLIGRTIEIDVLSKSRPVRRTETIFSENHLTLQVNKPWNRARIRCEFMSLARLIRSLSRLGD
jgi:hypothetical protein